MTTPLPPPAGPDPQGSPPIPGDERHQDRLVVDFVVQYALTPPFVMSLSGTSYRDRDIAVALAAAFRDNHTECRVMERTRVNGSVISLIALA